MEYPAIEATDPTPTSAPARYQTVILAAATVMMLLGGWLVCCRLSKHQSLQLDDAYITYRYGRNVADGHGVKFNPSDLEPTPGFSSLLHVGLSAAAEAGGVDPLTTTRMVNVAAWMAVPLILALVLNGVLGLGLAKALLAATLTQLVVSQSDELAVHMASGMETVLWSVIHIAAAAFCVLAVAGRHRGGTRAASVGGVAVILGMTLARPEGPVLAALYLVAMPLAYAALPASARRPGFRRIWIVTAAALAVMAGSLLAWQAATFGRLLPNPYYVKAANNIFGPIADAFPGSRFVLEFAALRLLPIVALLLAWAWGARVRRHVATAAVLMLLPAVLTIVAYCRVVHETAGAFRYEFPILIPVVIPATLLLGYTVGGSGKRMAMSVILALSSLGLASDYDARWLRWKNAPRFFATEWISHSRDGDPLTSLGLDLKEAALGQRATVLLSGAGSVPYHSDLRAIDWIGLNNNTLCGRDALSMDQVWDYISDQAPDVIYSVLPPASAGYQQRTRDPAFWSPGVQRTLKGRGSELFRQWNRERLSEMFWREMTYIRDHCVFGAAYRFNESLGTDWALLAYVRKDSPHKTKLLDVLRRSSRTDRTLDLGAFYANDPRELGR